MNGCDLCRLIWDSFVAVQNVFGLLVVATDEFRDVRIKALPSDLQPNFLEALGLVAGPEIIQIAIGEDGERANVFEELSLNLVADEGLLKVPFSRHDVEQGR